MTKSLNSSKINLSLKILNLFKSESKAFHLTTALIISFLITILHILFIFVFSPKTSFSNRFSSLCTWDCLHYVRISTEGYAGTTGDMVTFFPGFPLVTKYLLGWLDAKTGIVLLSQVFTMVFWFFLQLILSRFNLTKIKKFAILLLIASYPSSFFLVVGYSESLFMASLLSFVYFLGQILTQKKYKKNINILLSILSGFIMTSTRVIGLPIVALPIFASFLNRMKNFLNSILISTCASLGAIVFFGYCQVKFSKWDIYFLNQYKFWHINPDLVNIFDSQLLDLSLLFSFENQNLNAASVTLVLYLLFFCILKLIFIFFKNGKNYQTFIIPSLLIISAFLTLYIPLAGLYSKGLESMIRYSYPPFVLLILAFVNLSSIQNNPLLKQKNRNSLPLFIILLFFCSLCFYIQSQFIWRHTRSNWVACWKSHDSMQMSIIFDHYA